MSLFGQNVSTPKVPTNEIVQKTNCPQYVVLQVSLKEKLIGTGSGNLSQLEKVINDNVKKGIAFILVQLQVQKVQGYLEEIEFKQRLYLKNCNQGFVCESFFLILPMV